MVTCHPPLDPPGAQAIEIELTGGDPRTLRNVDAVVSRVLADPTHLDELIACVLHSDDEIVRMRAADALEKVCRARPSLLQPHLTTILGAMARIDQPSVQWHVAQMLGEIELTSRQRTRAVKVVRALLLGSSDWIVLNNSLDALATFARADPRLVEVLRAHLHDAERSPLTSLAKRARRLSAEFG